MLMANSKHLLIDVVPPVLLAAKECVLLGLEHLAV